MSTLTLRKVVGQHTLDETLLIGELGAFLARETAASTALVAQEVRTDGAAPATTPRKPLTAATPRVENE